MHDQLGHTLVALSVQIEAMKQQARESMVALRRTLAERAGLFVVYRVDD